jgi:hypothetical protein
MVSANERAVAATKLAKARDFYLMATIAQDGQLWDPAVSLAVSAAVNASDALCVLVLGDYPRGRDHGEAVRILRRAGFDQASSSLAKILALKDKAQYSAARCTESDGDNALKRAERLITRADQQISIDGVQR